MAGIILTAVLLGVYVLFLLWYIGNRRPLSDQEVDRYIAILTDRMDSSNQATRDSIAAMRKFALEDDGRQFFMCNLVKYRDRPQYEDNSDRAETSRDVYKRYARSTMPLLLKRACHPYGLFRPLVHLSNISRRGDNYWDEVNVVRYRSRRDFFNMVTSPQWYAGYSHKVAALSENPNMPSTGFVAFPLVPILLLVVLFMAESIGLACLYIKMI